MESILMTLFQSRDFAHFKHLETDSYARHIALGGYYEGIVDQMDKFAELMMSSGTKIKCPRSIEIPSVDEIKYFEALSRTVASFTKDTTMREDLKNVLIDVLDMVNTLLYKLKGLK